SLAAAVTSVFGAVFSRPGTAFAAPEKPLLGFSPVAVGVSDGISVPPGYRARVVTRLGDPLLGDMPEWRPDGTGAEQAMQIGSHHDGIHFFPIEGSSTDGLLVT